MLAFFLSIRCFEVLSWVHGCTVRRRRNARHHSYRGSQFNITSPKVDAAPPVALDVFGLPMGLFDKNTTHFGLESYQTVWTGLLLGCSFMRLEIRNNHRETLAGGTVAV